VTEDWEQRLFSAFLEQVAEPAVPTFVNCVERASCYARGFSRRCWVGKWRPIVEDVCVLVFWAARRPLVAAAKFSYGAGPQSTTLARLCWVARDMAAFLAQGSAGGWRIGVLLHWVIGGGRGDRCPCWGALPGCSWQGRD